jgi:hypothetical protein
MKKTILAAIALTGLVGFSNAGAVPSGLTTGDSQLFFYLQSTTSSSAQGYGTNVAIDLGNLNTPGFNYSLSGSAINAVLNATYGSGWQNNNNLFVGVLGTTSTSAIESYQDSSVPYGAQQLVNLNHYQYLAINTFNTGGSFTTVNDGVNNHAIGTLNTTSGAGIAMNYTLLDDQTAGSSLMGFNGNVGGQIGAPLSSFDSQDPTVLSLYGFTGDAVNDGQNVLGTVSIDNGGNIAVVSSTVPEPTTYALLGMGALLLVIAYRRKSNA